MAASCREEVEWLIAARYNRDAWWTTDARANLYRVSEAAHEFGLPAVARWIEEFLAEGD
jgi:hypothetical protein